MTLHSCGGLANSLNIHIKALIVTYINISKAVLIRLNHNDFPNVKKTIFIFHLPLNGKDSQKIINLLMDYSLLSDAKATNRDHRKTNGSDLMIQQTT
jgi:hypothetical protein